MKLKTIAIDDEPFALSVIEEYIGKVTFLDLKGLFYDPIKALTFIQENSVDLIFLDINMPDLTGIQFLKALENKPLIIFSTAYSEYAVESYEYKAVDYLLKPIEFERFLKATIRAKEQFEIKQKSKNVWNLTEKIKNSSDSIFIKSGTGLHNVFINNILYIEGTGNYITIICSDKKIMTLISMSKMLNMLPKKQFYRVHKSYIISIKYVEKIERHQLTANKKNIPIGITYRKEFFESIDFPQNRN
jgi:DNA-binding LytR/AlgR family response regulator